MRPTARSGTDGAESALLLARKLARRVYTGSEPVAAWLETVTGRRTNDPLIATRDGQSAAAHAYPLGESVARALEAADSNTSVAAHFNRSEYLHTVEKIVRAFLPHQSADGRIIDPYASREVQYSTPCFAWAASILAQAGDSSLLEAAAKALSTSLSAMAAGNPADRHGDFFTVFAVLAHHQLAGSVDLARRRQWQDDLRAIVPEAAYRDVLTWRKRGVHNWNVVAMAGEYMRSKSGWADDRFVRRYMPKQLLYFTPEGLYRDPDVPLAYDLWARVFLQIMVEHGYRGHYASELLVLLERGALTSLLLQSPSGEWPTGGRSAQHQWNEALQCVVFEAWATRHASRGQLASARSFRRAAQLALLSVRKWHRASGDLHIVKNRFDPGERVGYEMYSYHSQYNLMAAALLCLAWTLADDSIEVSHAPSETGGFAFALQEFHKLIGNIGGNYAEVDLRADRHYNSTGLLRLQRHAVDTLTGPSEGLPARIRPLATGVTWTHADHSYSTAALTTDVPGRTEVSFRSIRQDEAQVEVVYETGLADTPRVVEQYHLTSKDLQLRVQVEGAQDSDRLRLQVPFPADDGASTPEVHVEGPCASVIRGSSRLDVEILEPPNAVMVREPTGLKGRNGVVDVLSSEVQGPAMTYRLSLKSG